MPQERTVRLWALVVLLVLLVLAGRAVLAAGAAERGPAGITWVLGSLVLFIALFRRADQCLGQPVSASARALGLLVAFPGIARDLDSTAPGLRLAVLALVLGGSWAARRRGQALLAGGGIGLAAVIDPAVLVLAAWLVAPGRRRLVLGAIAGALAGAGCWELLAATFESVPNLLAWWDGFWTRSSVAVAGPHGDEWHGQGLRSLIAQLLAADVPSALSDGVYLATGLSLVVACRLCTLLRFPGGWSLLPATELAVGLALAALLDPRGDGGAFALIWPAAMVGFDAFSRSDSCAVEARGRVLWFGGFAASCVALFAVLGAAPAELLRAAPLSVATLLVVAPSLMREAYPTLRQGATTPPSCADD